jgi:hypothetical protein
MRDWSSFHTMEWLCGSRPPQMALEAGFAILEEVRLKEFAGV